MPQQSAPPPKKRKTSTEPEKAEPKETDGKPVLMLGGGLGYEEEFKAFYTLGNHKGADYKADWDEDYFKKVGNMLEKRSFQAFLIDDGSGSWLRTQGDETSKNFNVTIVNMFTKTVEKLPNGFVYFPMHDFPQEDYQSKIKEEDIDYVEKSIAKICHDKKWNRRYILIGPKDLTIPKVKEIWCKGKPKFATLKSRPNPPYDKSLRPGEDREDRPYVDISDKKLDKMLKNAAEKDKEKLNIEKNRRSSRDWTKYKQDGAWHSVKSKYNSDTTKYYYDIINSLYGRSKAFETATKLL